MLPIALSVLCWAAAIALVVWKLLSVLLRKRLARLAQLIPHLGGSARWRRWFVPAWSGSFHGLPVSVSIASEWDSAPPSLRVALESGATWSLRVARDTWPAGWAKRLGAREVATHDTLFDRAFRLRSQRPADAERLLRDDGIKRAIRDLFARGYHTLTINARGLRVTKSVVDERDLDPRVLQDIFAALETLRAAS